jgi:hypothetical protein
MAPMPEVGIFWLIDNKLVADSIPSLLDEDFDA